MDAGRDHFVGHGGDRGARHRVAAIVTAFRASKAAQGALAKLQAHDQRITKLGG